MDVQEAAVYLGVSTGTLRRWAQCGKIEGTKVGSRGDWRFTTGELEHLITRPKKTPSKFSAIQKLLISHVAEIEERATELHIKFLGAHNVREEVLSQQSQCHQEIIKSIAESIDTSNLSESVQEFREFGKKFALDAVKEGLRLEEAIDGIIFLKQVIWQEMDKNGMLDSFSSHEFYQLSETLGTLIDTLSSQVAFTYTDAFRKSEEAEYGLTAIIEGAGDAIIGKDMRDVIISWNPAAERMFGYSQDEAIGQPITLIVPKNLYHEEDLINGKIKKGGILDHYQTTRIRQDGKKIPVSVTVSPVKNRKGEIIGASKIIRDISKESEIQERLRDQAKILQTVNDAILVQNKDNKIIYWNHGAEELYGWTEKEAKGNIAFELLHTHFPIPLEEIQNLVLEKGSWQGELLHTTKNGDNIIVDGKWELLKKGKRFTILEINRDITQRKKLETQKDEFIGVASHELKTPVTSIKAYTQVLQQIFRKRNDSTAVELLGKMNAQINKLTSLISDLLDVTKMESGHMKFREEYFEFNMLVKETVQEVQRTTPNHEMRMTLGRETTVYGDRDRIGQVIVNFLTNAAKYSPFAKQIRITTYTINQTIVLCVQDFGVGIPKDKQEKVFEQFYRVEGQKQDTYPGLGLGLYISRKIIERQQGRIWVESEEEKGSIFCFSLPIQKHEVIEQKNTQGEEKLLHE